MARRIWVIGGDRRNGAAADVLKQAGYEVCTHGVIGKNSLPLPEKLEAVVLPFPSVFDGKIRGEKPLSVEVILSRLQEGSRVYGGLLGKWEKEFERCGAQVIDVYGKEPFTTANACVTAEGAVSILMQESDEVLQNSRCLVIGFGRIGRCLAQKLKGLGVQVTAAARKPSDLGLIEALGYGSTQTHVYAGGLEIYDFIVNTVPTTVLNETQLASLKPSCLLVELASQPGGFSPSFCCELGLHCELAPSLPARYAPVTAGMLYGQTILEEERRL